MKRTADLRTWVDEAVQTLGYIKPEASSKLVDLITQNASLHPKQMATTYRKTGEQLSREEKKILGLRANALMSKAAFSDLTEKGLAIPLAAHQQTILRACLAWSRDENIASGRGMGVSKWECLAPFPTDCPGCKRLNGEIVSTSDAIPTGPTDCFRDACAIAFSPQIDESYFRQSRPPTATSSQRSKPWWKFW